MTREEAINLVKQVLPCLNIDKKIREAFETLVPELHESEDEKIRKALLRCCDDWEKGRFGCMAKEDVPAIRSYLERRETVKKIRYELDAPLSQDINGRPIYFEDIQNSAEWSEDIIQKAVKEIGLTQHQIDWLKTNVFPPKQEWSEEDERNLQLLSAMCDDIKGDSATYSTMYREMEELKTWLKALRPQPHTISIKDATKFGNLEYERGVKDGIQSEKSRQWKPSDKELSALLTAYGDERKAGSDVATELRNLYYNLQNIFG